MSGTSGMTGTTGTTGTTGKAATGTTGNAATGTTGTTGKAAACMTGMTGNTATGTSVRFRCGHGASATDARITLQRDCPLCMLLAETKRSRAQLLGKVAAGRRTQLRQETRIGAEYEWICARGHSRYLATVRAALTGPGCPRCRANAEAPAARFEGGVPFMKPGLRLGTSRTEQRLRRLLSERLRLPHQVNAVRISGTFYGKPEVWPDIIIPALKVAIEYDDPGRDDTSHRGLKEASDREKDAALADVGWAVIRVRAGGLGALGPYSIVCPGVSAKVVDRILELLAEIRGTAAVEALMIA